MRLLALPGEYLPIIEVGVIALTAILFGALCSRLKMSTAMGYIIAGVALGPLGLRFLIPNSGLAPIFGEFGLFMLMFYLGLELNVRKFSETGGASTVVGVMQMVLSFTAGFIVGRMAGFSELEAAVLGAMLVATSTAIVSKFLIDNKLIEALEGRISLSVLIFQDFFAIFSLVLLTSLSTQRSINVVVLNALFFMIGAFFAVSKVSRHVLNILHGMGQASKIAFYAIGIGVLTAYFGVMLGLSASLGAYFAGLALAETTYGEKIKREIGFYREFFVLFFFVSFGATLFYNPLTQLTAIPALPELLPLIVIAALLVAAHILATGLAMGVGGALMGLGRSAAAGVTVLLIPLGEFVIILASAAQPLLPPDEFMKISTLAFLLILITGPLTPMLYYRRQLVEKAMGMLLGPFAKLLERTGKTIARVEKTALGAAGDNKAARIIESIIKNLVIALAVVYLAVFAQTALSGTEVSALSVTLPIYALVLMLVVYPLFRVMIELRSLAENAGRLALERFSHRRGKLPLAEEEIASAFTSVLLVAIGFTATAAVYYGTPERLYLILPVVYSILALLQLSRAVYNMVEHYDVLQGLDATSEKPDEELYSLSREFDDHSKRFRQLHYERETTRERIKEAMQQGDVKLVRSLLLQLKRKEQTILQTLSTTARRSGSPGLSKVLESRNTRKAFEEYLLKRAAEMTFDEK
ncbi:MAG: cation:proton antiporter [Candidatus Micrarchaeota archaeon]